MKYTHKDKDGMRWRFEGGRLVSEITDMIMSEIGKPPPIQRQELDAACIGKSCECCDKPYSAENPLSPRAPCHPDAPLYLDYWDGVLTLFCAVCSRGVVRIKVAE